LLQQHTARRQVQRLNFAWLKRVSRVADGA